MGAGNAKQKQLIAQAALNQANNQNQPFERGTDRNFFKDSNQDNVPKSYMLNKKASNQLNSGVRSGNRLGVGKDGEFDQDQDVDQIHDLDDEEGKRGKRSGKSKYGLLVQSLKGKKPESESELLQSKLNKNSKYDKTVNLPEDALNANLQVIYGDIMEEAVLDEYLRTMQFFKDEADEDDVKIEYKYANEKVSPARWDNQTVVHEIFRVIQDVTLYNLNLTARSEMGRLNELQNTHNSNNNQSNDFPNKSNLIPIGVKSAIQFINENANSIHDINHSENFTNEILYNQVQNKNLSDPPIVRQINQKSKLVLSLRVEFRKLLRTAICKVPVSDYVDGNLFLNQMQVWSSIPYHKRILRPICFASLNEKTPLVFVEDMAFVLNLEQVIANRSFYKGYNLKYELSYKILCCSIQIAEALSHAHQNGILHMNLHPGNIMVARCAQNDEQYGFFLTDFGDPLLLLEDTFWTDAHEKVFQRMLKFYPPHILSLIKSSAGSKKLEDRREFLRKIKQNTNVLLDLYSYGVCLLFMLTGGYEWTLTIDLQATFESKMQKAELIIDSQTLQIFKAILKKCLLIQRQDQPFEKISDILMNLQTAKSNVERILRENQVKFYSFDCNSKPSYEFPAGRRKEELLIKDYEQYQLEDFSQSEQEIFHDHNKQHNGDLLGKESKNKKNTRINDPDIIMNEATEKYNKQNKKQKKG